MPTKKRKAEEKVLRPLPDAGAPKPPALKPAHPNVYSAGAPAMPRAPSGALHVTLLQAKLADIPVGPVRAPLPGALPASFPDLAKVDPKKLPKPEKRGVPIHETLVEAAALARQGKLLEARSRVSSVKSEVYPDGAGGFVRADAAISKAIGAPVDLSALARQLDFAEKMQSATGRTPHLPPRMDEVKEYFGTFKGDKHAAKHAAHALEEYARAFGADPAKVGPELRKAAGG